MKTSPQSFADLAREAVADFSEHGFDSEARLERWLERLRSAARAQMVPQSEMEAEVRRTLESIYARLVEREELLSRFPGVGRFTLQRVRPELRAELQRRILASASLIKLNRQRVVEETLQRFAGWATSVPPGGTPPGQRREAATEIRKAVVGLPYHERRVAIDQGHRFAASLSAILAQGSNALAARWNHHYVRYPRPEHVARHGRVYLVRDSWAHQAGLVKPGAAGYTDEITQPAEEIQCRCSYTYLTTLRSLPEDMLTVKGKEALQRARQAA